MAKAPLPSLSSDSEEPRPEDVPSRLVYSALKLVARLAARFQLPMKRVEELAQLAYFEELRAQAPADLEDVAPNSGCPDARRPG